MEVLRGWLIRRSELWGSRLMDLWSRSGSAGQAGRTAATSASGRCLRWAASRGHTWKEWPNLTGRTTAHASRTTHPAPETRCSYQMATCDRRAGPSSPRLRGSTATFRFGHLIKRSFTLFKALCQTDWTSGAFVRRVEL